MIGTFINMGAIIAGSAIGASAGSKLPMKMRGSVIHGIGLITILIGIQMAIKTENVLIVLAAILLGVVAGELLNIEDRLRSFGDYLQAGLSSGSDNAFAEGFVTSSIVFCVGAMAILGSIADGLNGDFRLLSLKAVLDGFASIAFAASLGWGVAFSSLSILIYQGGLTLFANSLSSYLTEPMITEMTATGGLLIVGVGVKLLGVKDLRLANFVPAIAFAPVIQALIPRVSGFIK
jgi:uncharacterized protein